MKQKVDYAKIMAQIAGFGGDEYIGTESFSDKKFTHIVVGSDGATFSALTIRGVDVVSERNLDSVSLPSGYIISAGNGDYFDSGTISSGSAQGLRQQEDPLVTLDSVAVDNGTAATGMTTTLTFGNDGGAGSLEVDCVIEDSEGEVIDQYLRSLGTAIPVYFLPGESQTATIPGLTYPDDAGTDYAIRVKISGDDDTTEVDDTFDVTE